MLRFALQYTVCMPVLCLLTQSHATSTRAVRTDGHLHRLNPYSIRADRSALPTRPSKARTCVVILSTHVISTHGRAPPASDVRHEARSQRSASRVHGREHSADKRDGTAARRSLFPLSRVAGEHTLRRREIARAITSPSPRRAHFSVASATPRASPARLRRCCCCCPPVRSDAP